MLRVGADQPHLSLTTPPPHTYLPVHFDHSNHLAYAQECDDGHVVYPLSHLTEASVDEHQISFARPTRHLPFFPLVFVTFRLPDHIQLHRPFGRLFDTLLELPDWAQGKKL